MKKSIIALCTLLILLTACGNKPKPSTTPLHPSRPSIVSVSEDEMRNMVTSMTGSMQWDEILSSDLYMLMDEAQHLVMGNSQGEIYEPMDWSCHTVEGGNYSNNIEKINISNDSVTVDMMHVSATQRKAYTLVMKHENGHWCIDDVLWTGQQAPHDSERHMAGAYADDAITNLTTGDASYIIVTHLDAIAADRRSLENTIKTIETAHNFLKKNRSYTPELEHKLLATLQQLKSSK